VIAKKLVQKNEMMEIRVTMMDVLVIDLQLKLAGYEMVEAQLYKTCVLFVLQAGTKTIQSIQKHEKVNAVMGLKLELRYVTMETQLAEMDVQLIVYLSSLDGYVKVEAQLLQTCEPTALQGML
jgi:hypothetical protein